MRPKEPGDGGQWEKEERKKTMITATVEAGRSGGNAEASPQNLETRKQRPR